MLASSVFLVLSGAMAMPQATPASQTSAAPVPIPRPTPDGPVVDLETSMGTIRVGLYAEKAPLSTANFMSYVKSGHFVGTIFHRVIPGFMIQGGGMDAKMVEKPARAPIRNEARNGLLNTRGTLAMARTSDPHSATAQFFINVKDNPPLDFGIARDGWGYTVFGEVISGMEVVDAIVNVPTTSTGGHQNVPIKAIPIVRVKIISEPAKPAAPAVAPKSGAATKKPAAKTAAPRPKATPKAR